MQESIKILGVRINNVSYQEALSVALLLAKEKAKSYLTTPNPEILLEAQKNPEFKKVLNNSQLNIPDGAGLLWAARYQSSPLKERVTGTDLMEGIMKEGAKTNLKIFLLGAAPGVAEKVKSKMEKKYPGLKIAGTSSESKNQDREETIINVIDKSTADILFVAFGAPHQELWISRNLPKLKTARLAVGVGGAFDFLAGESKRAPKIMQNLGLEWLYRLFKQPKRFKRIFNAVIIFPIAVVKNSLKSQK